MKAKPELAVLVLSCAIAAALFLGALALIPMEARGDGSPGFAQIGHETDTPRLFAPDYACIDLDAVLHFIELSEAGVEAQKEFFYQMAAGGTCRNFPLGLKFWPDEVVMVMHWADGEQMYIIKGHDGSADTGPIYAWMTAKAGKSYGLYPPSPSEEH